MVVYHCLWLVTLPLVFTILREKLLQFVSAEFDISNITGNNTTNNINVNSNTNGNHNNNNSRIWLICNQFVEWNSFLYQFLQVRFIRLCSSDVVWCCNNASANWVLQTFYRILFSVIHFFFFCEKFGLANWVSHHIIVDIRPHILACCAASVACCCGCLVVCTQTCDLLYRSSHAHTAHMNTCAKTRKNLTLWESRDRINEVETNTKMKHKLPTYQNR